MDLNERSRTYFFTSGQALTIEDVVAIDPMIGSSTHQIYDGQGRRWTIKGEYDAVVVNER